MSRKNPRRESGHSYHAPAPPQRAMERTSQVLQGPVQILDLGPIRSSGEQFAPRESALRDERANSHDLMKPRSLGRTSFFWNINTNAQPFICAPSRLREGIKSPVPSTSRHRSNGACQDESLLKPRVFAAKCGHAQVPERSSPSPNAHPTLPGRQARDNLPIPGEPWSTTSL